MTMYALTLWQPMAWAIAVGKKHVENRPWPPPRVVLGDTIAIHAGQHLERSHLDFIARRCDADGAKTFAEWVSLPTPQADALLAARGAVIAVARVVGFATVHEVESGLVSLGEQRPWFFGPYGWLLDQVQALCEPVPCRGFQRLWRLKPDVETAVRAQIGGQT